MKEKITLEYGKEYKPSVYAKAIGVHPSRITYLRNKLITIEIGGAWFPIHCEENDKLFPNHVKPKNKK